MKFTLPDFRTAKEWIPERLIHFVRHYSKEIAIALALAIVAAIIIDPILAKRERRLRQRMIEDDQKAVATLQVFDSNNRRIGQGSGFFIKPSGVLVTNAHVIKGAGDVIAHLPSGAYYRLKSLLNVNEKEDIAVLQFDARETPSIKGFGDSDSLKIGDEVYALGTPSGLEGSYSAGTVSDPARKLDGETFIQFSAPISPGSSGGGLFDREGEAVGITAASQNIKTGPQEGLAQNLNFAVPINRLRGILEPEGGLRTAKGQSRLVLFSRNLGGQPKTMGQGDSMVLQGLERRSELQRRIFRARRRLLRKRKLFRGGLKLSEGYRE